ncbi:hypothetical protein A9Q75_00165 [Colwellia psychrerythraea]|uniref:Glycosyl transferase group 1 n=1 Tax=Colwellia psychrerythraea TaxID=28229 RepID=A0A1Y5ERM3_COLPS|nr:hypothetical protein A9Q75_00165 [Colwellia psychrerythraea]
MKSGFVKIKVAHIVGSLNVGGAERFVIDLCSIQKQLTMKPAIISLGSPDDPLVNECKANNIPVASYGGGSLIKLLRVFFVLLKFDIIHIHSPHALKFLSYILPLLNKKIIYTRHGAGALEPAWILVHKKAKRFIDIITCVSQESLEVFHQTHGWTDIPSYVIDNGVLIKPLCSSIKESTKLHIGSVGRMIPLKNQLSLLRSIVLLPEEIQREVEVNFFGDGECLSQLKQFYQNNITNIAVNFHGMVSDRELIYSKIDVLVVTSETEGLSMVIIEAMANRIPVIATDVGGNPKLVINEQTGWLFSYNDDEKLSEYIQRINDDRQVIMDYGDSAFDYVSANFTINSAAKKYATLYANSEID